MIKIGCNLITITHSMSFINYMKDHWTCTEDNDTHPYIRSIDNSYIFCNTYIIQDYNRLHGVWPFRNMACNDRLIDNKRLL